MSASTSLPTCDRRRRALRSRVRPRAAAARSRRVGRSSSEAPSPEAAPRRSSTPPGFTWDKGGHVVFSHFGEFDRLLDEALGDDVHEHERSSYVLVGGRWVPYPFQNNLRHLGPEDAYDCLVGPDRRTGR